MNEQLYFRSLKRRDGRFETTTYDPATGRYDTCQTGDQILESRVLVPNTVHRDWQKRLCVSALCEGYDGTYRSEGIIFRTEASPDYVTPIDLLALSDSKEFTSSDYNARLISGSERFVYPTVEEMLKIHPTSGEAIAAVNRVRADHGLAPLDPATMNYNECGFYRPITITPIAVVGKDVQLQEIASAYGLMHLETVEEVGVRI